MRRWVSAGLCGGLLSLCLHWVAPAQPQAAPEFPTAVPPPYRASGAPAGKVWTHQLREGWNLVGFPGQPQGPVKGLAYQPLQVNGALFTPVDPDRVDPRLGYWVYSEKDAIMEVGLREVTVPQAAPLVPGWNLIRGQGLGVGALVDGAVSPTFYSGDLGHFQAVPMAAGSPLAKDSLYFVYSNRPGELPFQAAGTAPPPEGTPGQAETALAPPPADLNGLVVDDGYYPIKNAKIKLTLPEGARRTYTDGGGRFRFDGLPTQGEAPLAIYAKYFQPLKDVVPLAQLYQRKYQLRRKTATLSLSAYVYAWGKQQFRPYSILVYEQGNYHRRQLQTYYYDLGWTRYDFTVPYFPQGRYYRIRATWRNKRGTEQSIVRDGLVDSSWVQINLWNSWSYSG